MKPLTAIVSFFCKALAEYVLFNRQKIASLSRLYTSVSAFAHNQKRPPLHVT